MKLIKVSEADLRDLIVDSLCLRELQDCGVDNWPGGDEANEITKEDIDFELDKIKQREPFDTKEKFAKMLINCDVIDQSAWYQPDDWDGGCIKQGVEYVFNQLNL